MNIYYAHHRWKYNTKEELKELSQIERNFINSKIINPNGAVIERGNEVDVMEQCFNFVRQSDVLIFTTLSDGYFGKGVYSEVSLALELNKPVYLLFDGIFTEVKNLNYISRIVVNETKNNRRYAILNNMK